eukprot:644971-Pleurochrysis_carterae.AAC.1
MKSENESFCEPSVIIGAAAQRSALACLSNTAASMRAIHCHPFGADSQNGQISILSRKRNHVPKGEIVSIL